MKKNVMLSLSKHLYRAARVTNTSGAVEMLRQAQHDVLSYTYCFARVQFSTPCCSARQHVAQDFERFYFAQALDVKLVVADEHGQQLTAHLAVGNRGAG